MLDGARKIDHRKNTFQTADSDTWNDIWRVTSSLHDEWDYLSEVIFQVLKREFGDFFCKDIIEAGSGTGRISLRLGGLGAKVTLLDYSKEALNNSMRSFKSNNLSAEFIQADIFNIKSCKKNYNLVWNAGVLEHYPYRQQAVILDSLIRICKRPGTVITFNPYSKSIVYNLGKKALIKLNRWPFGKEYPISTIYDIYPKNNKCTNIDEYSIGFIASLVDAYKFLPGKLRNLKIIKLFSELFIRLGQSLFHLDKFFSAMFGGYLIVSVIRKD